MLLNPSIEHPFNNITSTINGLGMGKPISEERLMVKMLLQLLQLLEATLSDTKFSPDTHFAETKAELNATERVYRILDFYFVILKASEINNEVLLSQYAKTLAAFGNYMAEVAKIFAIQQQKLETMLDNFAETHQDAPALSDDEISEIVNQYRRESNKP